MKKYVINILFSLSALTICMWARALRADDTTHVIINAEKTAEVVAEFCENTVNNPNPSASCIEAIEECQSKAGVAFAGQVLLKVSNKTGCIQLQSGTVKFYSCNNVAFADLMEDLRAIDANEHFSGKLDEVCKAETVVNDPPSDAGQNNSNDSPSNPNDIPSTSGGCSLQGQATSLSSVSWFGGALTLLIFSLARHRCKKEI